jgi:phospholipid transport system substrate-binding protein
METCRRVVARSSVQRAGWRIIAVLVWLGAWQSPAQAQQSAAALFIKQIGDQAIGILRSQSATLDHREAQFRQILSQHFDMAFIGRFVLGRHWQRANAEHQSDYQRLFQDFLVKTYASRMGGYTGETLVVVAERDGGGRDTVVRTRIERPSGPPIEADWRVRQQDAGYRIIDVEVGGVSMAITQRAEFDSLVQRNGVDGLIEVLRAKTSRLAATN